MEERENILRIFIETKEALEKKDVIKLKELSNQTIHTASVEQDAQSITTAVIIYSLGKILERTNYKDSPEWKFFYSSIIGYIDKAIVTLKEKDEEKFKKHIDLIEKLINQLSGSLKEYIQEVFRKACINKASRIYEHGISMEKTAKLLGITMYELADYAGKTGICEVPESQTFGVKYRIKLVSDMFK